MKKTFPLSASLLLLAAVAAGAADTVTVAGRQWRLSPHAKVEGEILVVEIPEGDTEKYEHCETDLDLSGFFHDNQGVKVRVMLRASDVTQPDHPWNGVKCMLRYQEAGTGRLAWPGWSSPLGTFDWTEGFTLVNFLLPHGEPEGGKATLVLGIQGCTGRAEFDLSTLRVEAEDLGLAPVNQDYKISYPESVANAPRLRGVMLPGRDTTEKDIDDLAKWGATMARFQITRNWWKINDNKDLDEYARWIDRRLDNLEQVLGWAQARGMKICIDLHALPGGKRGARQPEEMNMFSDDRYADAFVETWRRIATRFCGHPAIYGYDLVNEPTQRRALKHSYWALQKRAAEAVREIDPVTPIVFAANLANSAPAFRHLWPLAMDNVIYQLHVYKPNEFTHQGVAGRDVRLRDGSIPTWPGKSDEGETWDKDWLRKLLEPVREFEKRHNAKIYVGEFSAVAWADGAENYLRDCIELFEEYGWDWTYHAFREAPCWDVEKVLPEGLAANSSNNREMVDATEETPRKKVLLDGFAGRLSPAAGK